MSHLKYFNYDDGGKFDTYQKDALWYSQGVRIDNKIELSGQGGWDRQTMEVPTDLGKEIDLAFANIDYMLKKAGGKGWDQVYVVKSYHAPGSEEGTEHVTRNLKKWCPHHRPIWTDLGIGKLALPTMHIEIDVIAVLH